MTSTHYNFIPFFIVAFIHAVLGALAVFAPQLGFGEAHEFILFQLYQITRTDALVLDILSGSIWMCLLLARFYIGSAALLVIIGSVLVGLLSFDYYIKFRPGNMISGTKSLELSISTLDLHPYTGWHIQPNYQHQGDMPGEEQPYKDYDVKSGDMGFFIDFPLSDPPPKKPNEFRIILIGGSGAQGFGGRTNEDMFYRKLEKTLNERLSAVGEERIVRVINMAMASSITYQNFIALNRFAHPMKPDLILSYSGVNDWSVPAVSEIQSDMFWKFSKIKQFTISTRPNEVAPILRPLAEIFPFIFSFTHFGVAIKQLFPLYYLKRARDAYRTSRKIPYTDTQKFLDTVGMPFFIDAMKSIKRDFEGIPMMLAWQAQKPPMLNTHTNMVGTFRPNFYNEAFEQAKAGLNGYINDNWTFINVHKILSATPRDYINVHLGNDGHTVVADLLADTIMTSVFNIRGSSPVKTPK